ncbi:MAG: LCP family protein [Chloroflexi bacterium]|nr:LCP family protein [Chloroflexota bacterium]
MRSRIINLTCLLLLTVSACGERPVAMNLPAPFFLVTVPANPTPTLTPFQPMGFTNLTPTLTPFQPVGFTDPTSVPVLVPSESLSQSAVEPIPQPAGQISIILLGSDQRPNQGDFRTDVMMLVTIRPNKTISVVSFPRDMYVYLPGMNMQRLNAAMEFGGFDMLKATFYYNFGIQPQHYVLTNFSGFQDMVNSLGGVDVLVGQSLYDTRTGYPDGFTVYPGYVHMDGEMALWYVRSRKSTSDFDRLLRAQEVIMAITRKLLSLNALSRIPELYAAYRRAVVTDLALNDLLQLLPLLQAIDPGRVDNYTIDTNLVTPWIDPNSGSYYLLADPNALRQLLQQAVGTQ